MTALLAMNGDPALHLPMSNTVVVGAPASTGRIGVYDLRDNSTSGFTLNLPSGTKKALLPKFRDETPTSFGTELLVLNSTQFIASAPDSTSAWRYTIGSSLTYASISSPAGNADFGADNALTNTGSRTIIGATSGAGAAYLYSNASATGNYITLRPFKFQSSDSSTVLETSAVQFGRAPSIISDGFYLVGNHSNVANNHFVYNFRQRGPGWTTNAGLLSTPDPVEKAKLGSSVAIAGNTAILGAPDYGNHGAVFVYNNVGTGRDPVWELQAQIEAPGIPDG